VNPFVDIFVIDNSWQLSGHFLAIKGPLPFRQGDDKNISPLHLANISSSQLTLFITLFFFSNTKTLDIGLLPHSRGLNQDKL
jgi:hypothetical protein